MSFKARYVTVCQQSLVTAVVLAMGVTAAGVLRLDIVTPSPTATTEVPAQQPAQRPAQQPVRQQAADPAPVAERAVTPTVREVKVPAARRSAARVADPTLTEGVDQDKTVAAVSEPEKVTGYATVGVTWKSGTDISDKDLTIQVRSLKDGRWSDWAEADYHDDHGPDAGTSEAAGVRPGTDALVVGDVDRVQMRAETTDGVAPQDLQLAVVDPGLGTTVPQQPAIDTSQLGTGAGSSTTSDEANLSSSDGPIALSAMALAPKPTIYSRAQWGANEKMRNPRSLQYGTVKAGFVHHTVNANNYTSAQVPALIRGIYAYHTQSRGWSDIGYNFLVDRFGRIWEGRYGGVDRNPVGAHTLGYNDVSFAMSAIGNFDIATPPAAVMAAYGRLMAWKLSLSNISATATRIKLHTKYFNAINGHRDAGSTACPGRYLYEQLPNIRTQAAAIQLRTAPPAPPPPPAEPGYDPTQTPDPAVNQPSTVAFPNSSNLAGDWRPDLVVTTSRGALSVIPGGGVTGLQENVATGSDWNRFELIAMVGDITGDGVADFINRTKDGVAQVYRGTKSGQFRSGVRATRRFANSSSIAGVGNGIGNGYRDVVARDARTGRHYIYPGTGPTTFGRPKQINATWSRKVRSVSTLGDVNGDGRPDLGVVFKGGQIGVAHKVRGGFGYPVALPTLPGGRFLGAGDLDADGVSDLVFSKGSAIYALRGLGNGAFSATPFGPISRPSSAVPYWMSQVGGSRQADLISKDSNGRPVVNLHNGNRALLAPIDSKNITPTSQLLAVGDWDNDGKNDIITRHRDGDALVLRRGNGDGTFGANSIMSSGWSKVTQLAAVGDVTGDGRPDLVGRVGSEPMRIFPGDGKYGFAKPVWAPKYLNVFGKVGQYYWRTFEVPESIYETAGGTFVPIGGGTTQLQAARPVVAARGYDQVIGNGDWTGDGVPDLVVREAATGALWLLEVSGSRIGYKKSYLGNVAGYSLVN